MRTWQVICLDPYRADLRCLTAIQTLTFVENSTAHSLLLYVMIIAIDEGGFSFKFFLCELSLKLLYDGLEGLCTGMLVCT